MEPSIVTKTDSRNSTIIQIGCNIKESTEAFIKKQHESDIRRCMELSIIMKIIESDIRGFIESCTKYKQDVIVGASLKPQQ